MINLLKSDFYKLIRIKGIYICLMISIVFTIIDLISLNFISNYTPELINQDGIASSTVNYLPNFFQGSLITFIVIAVSIFCTLDFKSGAIKNIASKSFKREDIYLSKFITAVLTTVIMILINLIVFIVGATICWGFGDITGNLCLNLLKMLGLEFLVYIALTSLFTMVSYLIRQNGATIGINICILSFSSLILMLLSAIITKVLKSDFLIDNYWILNYPQMLASYNLENDVVLRCSLVSVITIILTALIGIFTFKKRDIK